MSQSGGLQKVVAYDDDVMLPSMFTHGNNIEEHMKMVKELKYKEGDLFLCTFPKAGTHWMGNLIYRLRKDPEEPVNFFPALVEAIPGPIVNSLPSPRLLVTHLRPRRIPREYLENGGKIVVCLRNPKDVAVSLFYHTKNAKEFDVDLNWDQFISRFVAGEVAYKNYLDYLLEWETFANQQKDTVLFVYYEDLKRDGLANLRRVAKHIGVEKSDEELNQVLADCSISNLRNEANKEKPAPFGGQLLMAAKALQNKDGKSVIYRKGEVGDWKNHFTVAQSEAYDKDIKAKLAESSFRFIYEL